MGLTLAACGIYLFVVINNANVFNVGCTAVGFVLAFFSLFACCLRVSKVRLVLYNMVITLLFLCMVAISVGYWVKRSKVLTWMEEHFTDESAQRAQELARDHQHITGWIIVGCTAVSLCVTFFGWCYFCSVKNRSSELEEGLFRNSVN